MTSQKDFDSLISQNKRNKSYQQQKLITQKIKTIF